MKHKQLYVIQMIDGPVKIGISQSPKVRLAQLQSGLPWKLALIRSWSHEKALLVEYMAHDLLKTSAMAGEWFDTDIETACQSVENAIQLVDAGEVPSDIEILSERAEAGKYSNSGKGFALSLTHQAKGGKASAEIKKAKAAEGVERIKQYWGMSADEWPTDKLRKMAGSETAPMAYNTIVAHIGYGREVARKRYLAALRRKATLAEKAMTNAD